MILLRQGCATIILVMLTVLLQSVGMVLLIDWIKAQFPGGIHPLSIFRSTLLVLRFTSLLICLHMLEIMLWSSFYRLKCFPTWEAAFYFSAASYSTVGSGDLLLNHVWRIIGPVESVTGVLMCGLSAGFLFAIVTRLVELDDPDLAAAAPARASGPPIERSLATPTACSTSESREQIEFEQVHKRTARKVSAV